MTDQRAVTRLYVLLFGLENAFEVPYRCGNVHMQYLADGAPSFLTMTNGYISSVSNDTQYST